MQKPQFRISQHPLVIHKVSFLRQARGIVSSHDYAQLMRELGTLLAYEATANLPLRPLVPKRPDMRAGRIIHTDDKPAVVPLVRSGLTMAEGVRSIIPSAYMGHIGVYYDLATDSVIEFMVTMPNRIHDRPVLVIDPFIDSGITACAAIDIILEYGVLPENIHFLTLIISKQGYNKLNANSSSAGVTFYATRIDGHSDDEIWFDDFDNMNERLYRTTNKPRRPQS